MRLTDEQVAELRQTVSDCERGGGWEHGVAILTAQLRALLDERAELRAELGRIIDISSRMSVAEAQREVRNIARAALAPTGGAT